MIDGDEIIIRMRSDMVVKEIEVDHHNFFLYNIFIIIILVNIR